MVLGDVPKLQVDTVVLTEKLDEYSSEKKQVCSHISHNYITDFCLLIIDVIIVQPLCPL